MSPERRVSLRTKLLLATAALLAAIGAGEALLRWQRRFVPDPITYVGEHENRPNEFFVPDAELGWRMKPGGVEHSKKSDGVVYRYNADGFRGPEDFGPKGDRTRIVFAGDSFTFGFGVNHEDSFPVRIERELEDVQVLNLGIPNYGVDQIWLSLRHVGLDLEPDLVVVGLFAGDFRRSQRAYRLMIGMNKPAFKIVDGRLVPKTPDDKPNALFRWLDRRSYVYSVGQIALRWLGFRVPFGEFWHLNRAILDQIREDCRAAGVPVLFVYIPYTSWKSFRTLNGYMASTGADFVNLPDAIPDHPWVFQETGHFDPEGHRLVAGALLPRIRELLGRGE